MSSLEQDQSWSIWAFGPRCSETPPAGNEYYIYSAPEHVAR